MNDEQNAKPDGSGTPSAPGTPGDGAKATASGAPASQGRRRMRRWTFAGLAAIAAGAFAFHSLSRAEGGPRCGPGGFMRHTHGAMDADSMGKFIDWRVSAMLSKVDATPEQKTRIADIAKTAARELGPLREQHQAARNRAMELLVQPTVDRGALEKLRADELQLAETLSRRATQMLADAAEVLTPAQREKLVQRWKDRRA